jgi:hypothetical protein
MMFIGYAVLFGFAVVMTVRGILKRRDISASFVLAVYVLITMFIQLHWNQIGNPFDNRFIS